MHLINCWELWLASKRFNNYWYFYHFYEEPKPHSPISTLTWFYSSRALLPKRMKVQITIFNFRNFLQIHISELSTFNFQQALLTSLLRIVGTHCLVKWLLMLPLLPRNPSSLWPLNLNYDVRNLVKSQPVRCMERPILNHLQKSHEYPGSHLPPEDYS